MANEYLTIHFANADPKGNWNADDEVAHEGETEATEGRKPVYAKLRSDKHLEQGEGWRVIELYLKAIANHIVFNVVVEVAGVDVARWRLGTTDHGNDRDAWLAEGQSHDFGALEIGNAPATWAYFYVMVYTTADEYPTVETSVLVSCEGVAEMVG